MKYSTADALKKHLAAAAPDHLSPLYVVLGKDDFLRKEGVEVLKKTLGSAAETILVEGTKCSSSDLSDLFESFSMFSPKRLVIVQDAQMLDKACQEAVLAVLARPNPKLFIVLEAVAIRANTQFYKALEKSGVVLQFPEEKPWEKEKRALSRVMEQFAKEAKRVTPDAAQLIIRTAGTDSSTLFQEVEKIILFVGEREEVGCEDVRAMVNNTAEQDIFQLRDALFSGRGADAFAIARKLLADPRLLLPVLRQLRTQVQMFAQMLAHRGDISGIQQLYPWMRGTIFSRNWEVAKRLGIYKCREALLAIDGAEIKGKNSDMDPCLLFDLVIARILA